jgi:hypothetical protein
MAVRNPMRWNSASTCDGLRRNPLTCGYAGSKIAKPAGTPSQESVDEEQDHFS